ncbi:MAG: DNA replication and repair protein RecF [Porticoccaceae bacterium]|nr:MAG: DNA replication and repair protein RecF [Porticoccaceae bacterium]
MVKTSLLEAIHILARGRSFRTRRLASVIHWHRDQAVCFGLVRREREGVLVPIGVERHKDGRFQFKVAYRPVQTASSLAAALAVQLLDAATFQLLEGPPSHRRAYLDWGVFHVEQGPREVWSQYQKCLKQRNFLLRHGKMDPLQMGVWERELAAAAVEVDRLRARHAEALLPEILGVLAQLNIRVPELEVRYEPGWPAREGTTEELVQQLARSRERDFRAGYTQWGPHRADLRVLVQGKPAHEALSRGQLKLLLISLKLAQGQLFRRANGEGCVFLLDDLAAELDQENRLRVGEVLASLGVQAWITGVEGSGVRDLWPSQAPAPALFHVEQGVVTREKGE